MKRSFALLAALVLTLCTIRGSAFAAQEEESEMTNLEFFQSLDFDDGLSVVTEVFRRFPLQYGTTLGLDGNPQVRPIEFKFEADGVLYFDTVTYYTSYREMLAHPYLQICVGDPETMTYVRLGGRVNFTDDREIVERCFASSPVLTSQFGDNRDVVIAYYLTEVWAEFRSFSPQLPAKAYTLVNQYDE